MATTLQSVNRSPSCLVLGWGFRGRRIQRRHFRLDQIQNGGRRPSWKTSNDHISVTSPPIDFVFGSRLGFSRTADPTAPFPDGSNSRWRPAAILENFKRPYLTEALSDRLRVWFWGGVFGDGRSNGTISGWIKFKMVTSGHLGKLQTAISQRRLVLYYITLRYIMLYYIILLLLLCMIYGVIEG